ncbi:hypothetical protein LOZ12_001712 [Ophidiomyces ophidiicola]|uniref:uncharacterized protein n=1 Tax=Ophidiomyces ophidiicola TaxID=1387563 RepID=UPI0020C4C4EE|nr:uncharacterized protein LOZ57_005064 [Ophidiomyces ophidiicola]KAI1943352.1 hypothetical protein LOZ57_005064 [Ophidiomyces ophidiicola]KAI1962657.1 hypothetical protein LOZ59_001990 [Ophidiomyces ophidiicola]KAI2022294.1 hypothetical protein LOZ45_004479 [Ophidiomyces ophidiicola]KAI2039834.1 hypothetical protein LOZ47_001917 [Ophidiomyces ophidiicola]KAI2121033.1 hypothetical protein LOZ42_001196 [Ophidiomyces ophidiicola]
MRVPIAVQLALLVLVTSLLAVTVISIATWTNNYKFVVDVKSRSIALTASLKAGQIAADLELVQSSCKTVVTRILIQNALRRLYRGNNTDENWALAVIDVQSALGSGIYTSLYQAVVFSRDGTGDQHGVLNVTGSDTSPIALPYSHPNGTTVMLGDSGIGYPPMLYPNLTYSVQTQEDRDGESTNVTTVTAFDDLPLGLSTNLFLGPLRVNKTFALASLTLPIINNTSATDILGFMTIVVGAERLQRILLSREGLDTTGAVLLLGPSGTQNRFPKKIRPSSPTAPATNITALGDALVKYLFPPTQLSGVADRHHVYGKDETPSFPLSAFPAVYSALTETNQTPNNATSTLRTRNEQNAEVAVGVARPQTTLVDWMLVVEQAHSEAWAPIAQLQKIILACVFGVIGFIALVVLPLAHFSVAPIRRLKEATMQTMEPPAAPSSSDSEYRNGSPYSFNRCEPCQRSEKKSGLRTRLKFLGFSDAKNSNCQHVEEGRGKTYRVPGKVQERKRCITDELSELTRTYNEMSDELMIQYTKLEERVAERTRELEISKKAAEAANESKTLFIANISHELKTPLNGILGMCAVCMSDDDAGRIKKSLRIVYKSGELLLHLLNDLLTFSKNEIDKVIQLDEKEFRLADIKSQVMAVFQKQIQEKNINFSIKFMDSTTVSTEAEELPGEPVQVRTALGPSGTGRLRDMVLWGDQHRILQILINLVSNSLKFTPERGKVEMRIKCIGELDKQTDGAPKSSFESSRMSRRKSKASSVNNQKRDEREKRLSLSSQRYDLPPLSPPINAKSLLFEFVVQDTGPGIPTHMHKRVFEPFVQGDPGLSKKYGGTGLGLSICSQLSRLMNGTIQLESSEGVGTTFTVRIPLLFVKERTPSTRTSSTTASIAPSARSSMSRKDSVQSNNVEQELGPRLVGLSQPFFAAVKSPTSSKPEGKEDLQANSSNGEGMSDDRIRVLVAEDNVVNQEVVLRMLKLEHIYDVTIAKDGQEAYEVVKANMEEGKAFNLILMDIQMPNVDGIQSTRLIREMGYSAPIVALSAFSEESNIKVCMDSGMNMFLSKPLKRPALKQVLNSFSTIHEESEAHST